MSEWVWVRAPARPCVGSGMCVCVCICMQRDFRKNCERPQHTRTCTRKLAHACNTRDPPALYLAILLLDHCLECVVHLRACVCECVCVRACVIACTCLRACICTHTCTERQTRFDISVEHYRPGGRIARAPPGQRLTELNSAQR